jgi:hypothetical protein
MVRRSDYLQLRQGRWFIRLRVPSHLVDEVGQTHIVKSLETADDAVARQRRYLALAHIWSWIGSRTVSDGWTPAWAAPETVTDGAADHPPPLGHDGIRTTTRKQTLVAKRDYKADLSLRTLLEAWLVEIKGQNTNQTISQHRGAILLFADAPAEAR